MTQHISMRGEIVDFNKLRLQEAEKPALGNANMNARGDIVGPDGIIIKTQEQIEAEYAYRLAKQQDTVKSVNIKDKNAMSAAASIPTHPATEIKHAKPTADAQSSEKNIHAADKDFEPESAPKSRRKIVESD